MFQIYTKVDKIFGDRKYGETGKTDDVAFKAGLVGDIMHLVNALTSIPGDKDVPTVYVGGMTEFMINFKQRIAKVIDCEIYNYSIMNAQSYFDMREAEIIDDLFRSVARIINADDRTRRAIVFEYGCDHDTKKILEFMGLNTIPSAYRGTVLDKIVVEPFNSRETMEQDIIDSATLLGALISSDEYEVNCSDYLPDLLLNMSVNENTITAVELVTEFPIIGASNPSDDFVVMFNDEACALLQAELDKQELDLEVRVGHSA